MRRTKPKVFLVAETAKNCLGITEYLHEIGAERWDTDTCSDAEQLIEVMGRTCYRSFGAGLNPNVTKVREGNKNYLQNIVKTLHGSVLEHASVSFIFHNVSRVVTHELVRHRQGTAFSQESLRYVRLNDLGLWLPEWADNDPAVKELFETTFKSLEELQLKMAEMFELDKPDQNFEFKKKITSFMRRVAPIGLSTTIGVTFNHRALRFVLVQRTSRHAEEEIRKVFNLVGEICLNRWPNLYADFKADLVDGYLEYTTPYHKI